MSGRWCVCVREKTHTHKHMKRGFMLIMRQIWHYPHWDVVFISLPPTIPSDHNSLCPDKPRERERQRRRAAGKKKMERWRKREQPTDHIMVVASVIWLMQRERLQFTVCVWLVLSQISSWNHTKQYNIFYKEICHVTSCYELFRGTSNFLACRANMALHHVFSISVIHHIFY